MGIELQVNFRPEQLSLYNSAARFQCRVLHRRFGKTWLAVCELLIKALTTKRNDWRGYYIAPTFKQAKRIAYDMLKTFCRGIPGVSFNEQELRADFLNGSRIQLLGAETYNSLRGIYIDHAVLDECAQIPSAAWSQVIRPALSDRLGTAVLMGTPAGRHNLLFDLFSYADTSNDPDWDATLLSINDTNVLPTREVKAMQREMSQSEYEQELLCSFNAAIRGAYYSKEMMALDARGQITSIKYEATAPIYCAMDLGWSDLMVCHFIQPVGTEHRFLTTKAYAETKLPDVVNDWKSLPFDIDTVIMPHDAVQHELTSGMTREQVVRNMGHNVRIAPRVKSKHEGIEQVRALLPHCWFDKDECGTTVEACFSYRAEYDETKRVVKLSPVHDWSSHYVDAIQTYATGRPDHLVNWDSFPRSRSPSASVRF